MNEMIVAMQTQITTLTGEFSSLDGKVTILVYLVGATLLPIWAGAISSVVKTSKILKFLGKGDTP